MSGILNSEFARVVDDFYRNAARLGSDRVVLQAGSLLLIVHNCMGRDVMRSWLRLKAVTGEHAEMQLRLAAIAIRRMIALDRVTLLELRTESQLRIEATLESAVEIDILA